MENFLHLSGPSHTRENAKTIILPAGYEHTTSYLRGTEHGPEAILAASEQLEYWDSELQTEPCKCGIFTLPELNFKYKNAGTDLEKLYEAAYTELATDKFLITLGGEHTVTVPVIRALHDHLNGQPFGIVHLDAHFDLRDEYENSKYSHACILRRCREFTPHTLSLGVRAFSKEEAQHAKANQVMHVTDYRLENKEYDLQSSLAQLPETVYLTIDLDFFSPADMPGVGTPVPGGPGWWEGLKLIREVFETKNVIASDVVELCPEHGAIRSDFMAAMLVYKCIGYKFNS